MLIELRYRPFCRTVFSLQQQSAGANVMRELEENVVQLSIFYLNQQRLLTETAEYFSASTSSLCWHLLALR